MNKLGIDEKDIDGDIIYLRNPPLEDAKAIESGQKFSWYKFRLGKDGCFRFCNYDIMILIPTKTKLGVFRTTYNLIRNTYFHLQINEYYWKHIVSIRTENNQELRLTFADAQSLTISIQAINCGKGIGIMSFDEMVKKVRIMLETHKVATI